MTPLYTLKETANLMTVSVSTVKLLIRRGELGIVKVGGSTRVKETEITRYLRSRERRGRRAA